VAVMVRRRIPRRCEAFAHPLEACLGAPTRHRCHLLSRQRCPHIAGTSQSPPVTDRSRRRAV